MNITPFRKDWFEELPVVGILRGFASDATARMISAALDGGLRNVEITMNSPGASEQIRRAVDSFGSRANIGAGTVTSPAALEQALSAGASFIVTPIVIPEVIESCVRLGVPVMPGAMSPTEIVSAWELGATVVKVFPADGLGPAYLRSLRGPLPHIPLMPTGGVTVESLPAFRSAGAVAFGVGTPLFDPARAAAGDWTWFQTQAERFTAAWTSR